jgi:peptide-methionine (R)-S-oxide reductase
MSKDRLARREFIGLSAVVAAALTLIGPRALAESHGFSISQTPAEWKRALGGPRYHILREGGTEPPYSSPLLKEHRKGTFRCAACDQALFLSSTKFESGTGWPSFWQVLAAKTIARSDRSLGMERTEVLCARCGGHLGHVFNDGPRPTGLRYCMNGLALTFRPG